MKGERSYISSYLERERGLNSIPRWTDYNQKFIVNIQIRPAFLIKVIKDFSLSFTMFYSLLDIPVSTHDCCFPKRNESNVSLRIFIYCTKSE